MSSEKDAVDRIVAQWARERPELDTGPMAVIGRLHRLADLLEGELRTVFASAGLGNGDFDVLASLRRSGAPYRLSPGDLSATTMVTSGAVTKRVDRLEQKGLVKRSVSDADGRGREIELTPRGKKLTDADRGGPLGERGPAARGPRRDRARAAGRPAAQAAAVRRGAGVGKRTGFPGTP